MKLDVLAIGAHPDDVELAIGGTVAMLVERGYGVGIVHLTRGERGTRGTPEAREQEARCAATALGVEVVHFLNCVDGSLQTGEAQEDAVIGVIRRHQPDMVLGPAPSDRHPDHGRAHRLVRDAAFYSGLARRATGPPHRPAAVFSYMQHDAFEPSFIVDVTATWAKKEAALGCYPSQLYQASGTAADSTAANGSDEYASDEPMTKVASPEYAAAVAGRARHYGQAVNAEFGEPFWSGNPLAVADPLQLLPGGLR